MAQIADTDLIKLIKRGDNHAFASLYNSLYAPLVVFAERYISDPEVRSDCVHDVFLRIWEKRDQIEDNTEIRKYLFRAVQNRCFNIISHNKVEQTYKQMIINKYDPFDESDLCSIEELETMLHKAIAKLPEKLRHTFVMSRIDHLSHAEIAEKEGISQKTVEAHITKSLRILSVELREYYPLCFIYFLIR